MRNRYDLYFRKITENVKKKIDNNKFMNFFYQSSQDIYFILYDIAMIE